MSLAIYPEKVTKVLLGGTWHRVNMGTFRIDAFEFVDDDGVLASLDEGFGFQELHEGGIGRQIYGPLTAIQAVEEDG